MFETTRELAFAVLAGGVGLVLGFAFNGSET